MIYGISYSQLVDALCLHDFSFDAHDVYVTACIKHSGF